MKNKTLINGTLIGLFCTALTFSLVMVNNHNVLNVVYSQENEYTITLDKDTMYSNFSYNDGNPNGTRRYAFFPLKSSNRYAILEDHSFAAGEFGGSHLYTNTMLQGCGFALRLFIDESSVHFFSDKAQTQEYICPGFRRLTKIEITTGSGNEVEPDDNEVYPLSYTPVSSNKYKIECDNFSSIFSAITLIGNTTRADQDGKKIVIDRIDLTYTC